DPMGKAIRRWDVATGKQIGEFILPMFSEWGTYALSPDGKTLFARPWAGSSFVHVYDAETGNERAPQRPDIASPLGCVAVSPDGRLLATGSMHPTNTTVGIFDLATGKPQARWPGHANGVRAFAFSTDGRWLASTGEDGWIRLRDLETGKERLAW